LIASPLVAHDSNRSRGGATHTPRQTPLSRRTPSSLQAGATPTRTPSHALSSSSSTTSSSSSSSSRKRHKTAPPITPSVHPPRPPAVGAPPVPLFTVTPPKSPPASATAAAAPNSAPPARAPALTDDLL